MLKYPVYVRNITNLSDARYCAGMGVELLGFCFDVDSGIEQSHFEAIKGWVTGVKFVAEFKNSNQTHILETIERIKPDFILLDSTYSNLALQINIPVIFEIEMSKITRIFPPKSSLVLLSSSSHNAQIHDNHQLIKEMAHDYEYKMFFSYGFNAENIENIFSVYQPFGISLLGEDELEPGLKNFEHLSEIFEAIEI